MVVELTIDNYFLDKVTLPVIDVRSPGEFTSGHISHAINIPLFDDEERASVGKVYKQKSKEAAIALGYEYVTPKLEYFLEESEKVAAGRALVIYCWRGGMRSHAFAEHLCQHGFSEIYVIEGGYKAFRNYVLGFFTQSFNLYVLGGYTGSGKTYVLHELAKLGEQVIDLEGLAHHKGSAFGALGELPQPSSEHFENLLFEEWRHLDRNRPVWIEDESARIGCVQLPTALFEQMREQLVYFLDVPKRERAMHLVEDYAKYDTELLIKSVQMISKRLGGKDVKAAIEALHREDYLEVALLSLHYYDKAYWYGISKREPSKVVFVSAMRVDALKNAERLIELVKNQN